jgi:hypothetical protein
MATNNTTQADILDELERIKQSKNGAGYMAPKAYGDFMPTALPTTQKDDTARRNILTEIGNKGLQATAQVKEESRQRKLQEQYIKMKLAEIQANKELKKAKKQKQVIKVQGPDITKYKPVPGAPIPSGTKGAPVPGNTQYPTVTPPPGGGLSGVGVGQNLVTVSAGGFRFTVNRSVASRFTGFVNALVAKGYKPVSIGSYANRNQANGSGLKSLHAYGLAIDIDPAKNPFTKGPAPHAMPDWAGSLAAKYGLHWGGNWQHSKDYMHFSVPYGGRE